MIYLVNNLVNTVTKSGGIQQYKTAGACKLSRVPELLSYFYLWSVFYLLTIAGSADKLTQGDKWLYLAGVSDHHGSSTAAMFPAICQECRYFFICPRSVPAVLLTTSAEIFFNSSSKKPIDIFLSMFYLDFFSMANKAIRRTLAAVSFLRYVMRFNC